MALLPKMFELATIAVPLQFGLFFSPKNGETVSSFIDSVSTPTSFSQTAFGTAKPITSNTFSFQDTLSSILEPDEKGNVNEEQLFAAIIEERLITQAGKSPANTFSELYEKYQQELQWENGYVPLENAAEKALGGLVEEGILDQKDADDLHSLAFQAAQLDDDKTHLYDSMGSTMAVMFVNLAIEAAEEEINAIASGAVRLNSQTTEPANAGEKAHNQKGFVGGNGFLYKPISEGNGNLVILLPSKMAGNIESVELLNSRGNALEQGDSFDLYDDGRPVFRFNKVGADYPDNLTVRINLESGGSSDYFIEDSSLRWE